MTKRAKLLYEAQLFNLLTLKEKQLCIQFGGQFNYDLVKCLKYILTLKDEKGKPLIKETRYQTIKKHEEPYKKMYEFNSKNEKLCTYLSEKTLLGYSYSINLIDIYKQVAPDLITIEEVNGCLERERVHFVGEAIEIISRKGKESGRKYLKVLVQDHTSSVWAMLNDSERENKIEIHKEDNGRIVKEGDIVSCRGVKGLELVFADRIGLQEKPVIFKTSEIKEENK